MLSPPTLIPLLPLTAPPPHFSPPSPFFSARTSRRDAHLQSTAASQSCIPAAAAMEHGDPSGVRELDPLILGVDRVKARSWRRLRPSTTSSCSGGRRAVTWSSSFHRSEPRNGAARSPVTSFSSCACWELLEQHQELRPSPSLARA
jgi:hypothetical protein